MSRMTAPPSSTTTVSSITMMISSVSLLMMSSCCCVSMPGIHSNGNPVANSEGDNVVGSAIYRDREVSVDSMVKGSLMERVDDVVLRAA